MSDTKISGCDTLECTKNSAGQCTEETISMDAYGECEAYEEETAAEPA